MTNQRKASNQRHDQKRRAEKPWRSWYKTARWQSLRSYQLTKQPLCERCFKAGKITPATVAHHKVPHRGDPELFFRGELASSCAPCHDIIEQGIEARGYDKAIGPDGLPLDVLHPWNRK